MPRVFFSHGEPQMVDFTPATAVTAGDVIVTADTPRIAHSDCPVGVLGALASAGGIYQVTADGAIPADRKVYWDAVAGKYTLTVGANKPFGVSVQASAADGDVRMVRHDPAM